MLTQPQRDEMIACIARLPVQLEALVHDLSPEQLTTHYLPNEWSVAQNVHHLADSHMNSFIRLKLILTEDHPTLKPYDQDAWAVRADADNLAIQSSLGLLQGLHRRWVTLFESLQEREWSRTGLHPENGEVSVEDLLRGYADHGEGHLDQITRTLAAQG
ncbi:MAG: putative metal-dependent hydrolase [Chloroflexi bacterium]|nr:putative metal-dependent hydrolase [Chloroflexota bacterium]